HRFELNGRDVELPKRELEAPKRPLGALPVEVEPERAPDLDRATDVLSTGRVVSDRGLQLGQKTETRAQRRRLAELFGKLSRLRCGCARRAPVAAVVIGQGEDAQKLR